MIVPRPLRFLLLSLLSLSPLRALDTLDTTFAPVIRGLGNVSQMAWHPQTSTLYAYVSGDKLNGQILASKLVRFHADGTWDTSYAPVITGAVSEIVMLPDGKILLAGSLTSFNGHTSSRLVRLLGDGSVDTSFSTPGGMLPAAVRDVAVGGDGSIYMGVNGTATTQSSHVNGSVQYSIVWPKLLFKLSPDGAIDTGFSPQFKMAGATASSGYYQDMSVESLLVTPTGEIIAGGNFTMVNSYNRAHLVKLGTGGSVNASYSPALGFTSGPFMPWNSPEVQVTSMADAGAGKHYVAGMFNTVNGVSREAVVRLDGSGAADPDFSPQLDFDFFGEPLVNDLKVDDTGQVVLSGEFVAVNGIPKNHVARVSAGGVPDPLFEVASATRGDRFIKLPGNRLLFMRAGTLSAGGTLQPQIYGPSAGTAPNPPFDLDLRKRRSPDFLSPRPGTGPIVGGLWLKEAANVNCGSLVALTAEGNVDPSFQPDVRPEGGTQCSLVLPDGRVLIGGMISTVGGLSRRSLALLEADGSPVEEFDLGAGPDQSVDILRLMPSGKVLAAGNFYEIDGEDAMGLALLDLKALPGTKGIVVEEILEARYGTASLHRDVRGVLSSALSNGKLEISISNNTMGGDPAPGESKSLTVRFRTNRGERTATFPGGESVRLPSVAWDSGLLDREFRPANTEVLFAKDAAGQADGKIVVLGSFSTFAGHQIPSMVRLNPDGSVDTSFQPAGQFSFFHPEVVEVSSTGQIYIGDLSLSLKNSYSRGIHRLTSSGALDPTFLCPSFITWVQDIKVHPDGGVWCSGTFGSTASGERRNVARLLPDGSLDTRFDAGDAADSFVHNIALEAPGKLWMNGTFTTVQGQLRDGLALVNLTSGIKPLAQVVPNDLEVTDSVTATFSVSPTSAGETYAWSINGEPVTGSTGPSLTLTPDFPVNNQMITAAVTNIAGTTISSGTLTVREATLGEWLVNHGISGLMANMDSDGDGRSNISEYLARTDPGNGMSVFATGIEHHTGSVRLTWKTYPGRRYVIEKSADLHTWIPAGLPILGTGEEEVRDLPHAPEETALYWRVSVSKP